MPKRRKLLTLLACIAAISGIVYFAARDTEPEYQGRSLSRWLMIYYESDRPDRDIAKRRLAAAAIREIGTNALPRLLAWTRYEAPAWHSNISRALPRGVALRAGNSRPARSTVYRNVHRAQAAQMGFRLLGTNAAGAIPELTKISQNSTHPQTAARAVRILQSLTNAP